MFAILKVQKTPKIQNQNYKLQSSFKEKKKRFRYWEKNDNLQSMLKTENSFLQK